MKYDLERFIKAQELDYELALTEIRMGQKRSHWMWYIFPQIAGLGKSETTVFYSLANMEEARAYYEHPVLGKRLKEITQAALDLPSNDPYEVFGYPDNMKFMSCMTLFNGVAHEDPIFSAALEKFFRGERDMNTVRIIRTEIRSKMEPITFPDLLKVYETRIIPNVMFKNTEKFFRIVLMKDNPLYEPLERMVETEKLANPYTSEDFKISTLTLPGNIWVIKFDFPTPFEGGLCYGSYVIYDPDMTQMMYFTLDRPDKLETGWDNSSPMARVCSTDANGKRHEHGFIPLGGNEALMMCVEIYMDRFKDW